jgi:hypothetical protein
MYPHPSNRPTSSNLFRWVESRNGGLSEAVLAGVLALLIVLSPPVVQIQLEFFQ